MPLPPDDRPTLIARIKALAPSLPHPESSTTEQLRWLLDSMLAFQTDMDAIGYVDESDPAIRAALIAHIRALRPNLLAPDPPESGEELHALLLDLDHTVTLAQVRTTIPS